MRAASADATPRPALAASATIIWPAIRTLVLGSAGAGAMVSTRAIGIFLCVFATFEFFTLGILTFGAKHPGSGMTFFFVEIVFRILAVVAVLLQAFGFILSGRMFVDMGIANGFRELATHRHQIFFFQFFKLAKVKIVFIGGKVAFFFFNDFFFDYTTTSGVPWLVCRS